jgi:acyl carrier protein
MHMGSALEPADTFVIPQATESELQEAIDHAAHFYLGMSAEEFLKRWREHELREDDPQVQNVLYAMSFVQSGFSTLQPRPPLGSSESSSEYAAPRTSDEVTLVNICENLLARPRISIRSNFFELGGHSLLAIQLASRVRGELGIVIPLSLIFQNPTISELAEAIERLRSAQRNEF